MADDNGHFDIRSLGVRVMGNNGPADRSWLTPTSGVVFTVAATAWAVTVRQARSMEEMPGAMGTSLPSFIAMWSLMMAAMMLPSVTPLASRYTKMIHSQKWFGLTSFATGYLVVWGASGGVAFMLAWSLVELVVLNNVAVAKLVAATTFATCGVYQPSSIKYRCLAKCRAPFSLLLEYASWRGTLRHFRVGAHHGAYCLGCCWALMVLMFVFGVMNIGAMLILSVVIAIEKTWTTNEAFPRAVGWGCLALAVAVAWFPALYSGLDMK